MFRPFRSIARIAFVFAAVLTAMALLAGNSVRADSPSGATPATDPAALDQVLGNAIQTLQATQRELSSIPLDEDGVIDRAGRDPAKLCQWVRTNIAYEPYRGFLKGGRGALIAGRANSADKALLLAELLIKAGFKSQLVQGDAAPAAPPAREMNPVVAPDEKALSAFAAKTGISVDRIRQMQQAAASDSAEFNERLWNRALGDMQTVAALLDQSRIPVPPLVLAAAPADHWWVRLASGDLDPTFDAAPEKGGRAFDPLHLPPAECHQVTIRVMIRRDKTDAKVLQTSYRSTEMFGRTLTVANLPLDIFPKLAGVSNATSDKVLDVLATASKFQPAVMLSATDSPDGTKVFNGKGFDLSGTVFEVSHGQVQSAQGMGGGLGGMFGGGGGPAKPTTKLTAAWIEIDLISPGQAANVSIHRDLFTNSAELTPRQKVFDLLATREMLLLPEDLSEDYVTSLSLASVAQWAQYLSGHAQKDLGAADPKAFQGRPQFNSTLFAFAMARHAALRQLCDGRFGVSSFTHARPTMVSYVSRFIDGSAAGASRCIDIMENTILPAGTGGRPAAAGWAGNFGLACGVVDTALEHEILRNGETHQNASVALEQQILEGAAPIVVAHALPADLKLSEPARATIEPELARSAFVVVPGAPAAWYRVGLDNGMTLGFVEGGGGQEAAEYGEMGEIMSQLKEALELYGDLGRCLGAAISNPLVGKTDPHENLAECFKALCDAIPGQMKELAEVEAVTWQDKIIIGTVNQVYKGLCEKLWDKLGPGEGSGGGGGGGE
jgi:hypothetical protein